MASATLFPASFNLAAPAVAAEISRAENQLGQTLPTDYRSFLGASDGGRGTVGGEHLVLWPVADLVPTFLAHEMNLDDRPLLMFASDGGAMIAAFDMKNAMAIVVAPLDGLDFATPVAGSFFDFVKLVNLHGLSALWRARRAGPAP